jgi:hypothetical protein
MVGVWSTFTETEEKVDREAGALAALYMDVSHYPSPNRERLQKDLRDYTHHVIEVAWPQQKMGIIPKGNLAIVGLLAYDLACFEPTSEGQRSLHEEAYRQFNELILRRRSRLLGVTAGLSSALWALVLIGAVINIAVTWCFHLHNKRMHIWMTMLTSSLLGLMIFLLAAMDRPYMGELSVTSQPFQLVYNELMKPDEVAAPSSGGPSASQSR